MAPSAQVVTALAAKSSNSGNINFKIQVALIPENFYQLLQSGDIENIKLAWQIARGQQAAGDSSYDDFFKAAYSWTFGDFSHENPYNFLTALGTGNLNCQIWRKPKIPAYSAALSPLVKSIYIRDIQTTQFPRGFECFKVLKQLYFGSQFLSTLGDELAALPSLERLSLLAKKDFEILPEFANCRQLKFLTISSRAKLQLPAALSELPGLKELEIMAAELEGPLWTIPVQDSMRLRIHIDSDGEAAATKLFSEQSVTMNPLRLYVSVPDVSTFPRFFKEHICAMTNLEVLDVYSSAHESPKPKIGAEILQLVNLKELMIDDLLLEELFWLAKLPKLKKIEVFYLSTEEEKKFQEQLKNWGSSIELTAVDLPF